MRAPAPCGMPGEERAACTKQLSDQVIREDPSAARGVAGAPKNRQRILSVHRSGCTYGYLEHAPQPEVAPLKRLTPPAGAAAPSRGAALGRHVAVSPGRPKSIKPINQLIDQSIHQLTLKAGRNCFRLNRQRKNSANEHNHRRQNPCSPMTSNHGHLHL